MIDFAILDGCQRVPNPSEQWLLLFHGWYEKIGAQILNSLDWTYNARCTSSEHFQQLYKETVEMTLRYTVSN